jgi:hypothetical protein
MTGLSITLPSLDQVRQPTIPVVDDGVDVCKELRGQNAVGARRGAADVLTGPE